MKGTCPKEDKDGKRCGGKLVMHGRVVGGYICKKCDQMWQKTWEGYLRRV